MRLGVVYKITIGSNFIIGSTLHLNKRENNYRHSLKNGTWKNDYLQNSFNKSSDKNVNLEILQKDIPENILNVVEDIWIGALCSRVEDRKNGMNMRDGQRPNHNIDTREKISKANKGKKRNEQQRKNISTYLTGHQVSEKTREKLSVANSQKVYQYDVEGNFIKEWASSVKAAKELNGWDSLIVACCKKRKKSHKKSQWFREFKGLKVSPKETNISNKPFYQKTLDGLIINKWHSLTELKNSKGFSIGNVSSCLNNKRKTSHGFKWEYL